MLWDRKHHDVLVYVGLALVTGCGGELLQETERRADQPQSTPVGKESEARIPTDPLHPDSLGEASDTQDLTTFELIEARAAQSITRETLSGEDFLGFVIEQVGDVSAAPERLERMLERGPATRPGSGERLWQARLHYAIGGLLARRGSDIEATGHFEQAIELRPDLSGARIQLGNSLARQRIFDQAVVHYTSLLESDPDNAEVLRQRANAWLNLKRFDDAGADLQRAVAVDPGNGQASLRWAMVLRRANRPKDAFDQLDRALATDLSADDRLLAHRNAAALLQELGRDSEVLTHLDAAITLAPADVELKRQLARLLASSPDDAVRDGDRALALAEELFGADRSLSNAEILAMALAAAGRFEEAANWQRRLIAEAARFGYLEEIPRLRRAQNRYKQRRPALGGPATARGRSPGTE